MTAPPSAAREFVSGFATLGRGFAFWRHRPDLMALGLLPAAIVGAIVVGVVVVLVLFLNPITTVLTPFAAEWDPVWASAVRILVGIAVLVAVLALAARTFTALTLLVGTPFYDRIQEAVDEEAIAQNPLGFWANTGATALLLLQSVAASLFVLVLGLIPVLGSLLAAVAGFVLTARALSRELTLGPFGRRGMDRAARARARGAGRARTLGFGIAVQLCFLVPLGAIVTMPAAVAGASLLARDLLAANRAASEAITPTVE